MYFLLFLAFPKLSDTLTLTGENELFSENAGRCHKGIYLLTNSAALQGKSKYRSDSEEETNYKELGWEGRLIKVKITLNSSFKCFWLNQS